MRKIRVALAIAVVLVAWMGLAAGAKAKYVHNHEGTFLIGDPGGFSLLMGVSVDNSGGPSDGMVYVANHSLLSAVGGVVEKFDPDGNPIDEFDGAATPAGSFNFISFETGDDSGIAIDNSGSPNAGDIYVGDVESDTVNRFSESGEYICQITGSATPSASECNGAAGSATPSGTLAPSGIAVDESNGDLYVTDFTQDAIFKFDASGAYLGQIVHPSLTAPNAISIDSTGALYVANTGPILFGQLTDVVKLAPDGSLLYVLDDEEVFEASVDPSSDNVYVMRKLEESRIVEYDSAGNQVSPIFGIERNFLVPTAGVSRDTGRVYVGNTRFGEGETSRVEIYSAGVVIPLAEVSAVSDVTETSATAHGSVDPDGGGDVTSCEVEYVAAADYDPEAQNPYAAGPPPAPCSPATPYPSPLDVSADLTGLTPSTTYHFRFAAANANGVESYSEDAIIHTMGVPTVEDTSVTDIERFAAVLRAKINPRGFDAEFRFEFVDEEHYLAEGGFDSAATRSTTFSGIGEGLKLLSVSQGISGLAVGTKYRYRAIARNERGTAIGPEQTFTTVPIATIDRQWAYAHFESATVEATIDPLGMETQCRVEYVEEARFQQSGFADASTAPCVASLGAGSGDRVARAEIEGLPRSTKYRFRFVAFNDSGVLTADASEPFSTFGIEEFEVEVIDAEGNPYTQAGGHPYESITHLRFSHTMVPAGDELEGSLNAFAKNLLTEAPPGRVGDVDTAVPQCPGYVADEERCSGDTQVGTMTVEYFENGAIDTRTRALFNVEPPRGTLSRYSSIDPYTQTDGRLDSGGTYAANSGTSNITEEARVIGATARLWGVPADPRHDPERNCAGGCTADRELVPMLRTPTSCTGPLETRASVDTWQRPGEFVHATSVSPAIDGCEDVPFDPSLEAQPTTSAADSPSGLRFNIHIPQNDDAEGIAAADLRNSRIVPSPGLVLNPAVAHGLVGCTAEQIEMDGGAPARCPDAAKIGSAEIKSPLLSDPLRGGIYVATPYDNEFNSLFAIYVAIDDPETGVVIKLAGRIDADPQTGQLTSSFSDNPQLPFEDFRLDFFGGPRAVLRTPATCGTHRTEATMTPWSAPASGPPAQTSDSYWISSGPNGSACVDEEARLPHKPAFRAGSVKPLAGAYSPFVLRLNRDDGTQQFADLSIDPPPGLLGRLAGRSYCPEGALDAVEARSGREETASPSCPPGSRVGRVRIGAGAGPAPYYVDGAAYLAGPYRGAPLSLAVVVPAVAGPYDLGTVLVRSALRVKLESGEISVKSQPIPTVLEGVRLDVRSIEVHFDRRGFTLNPTSCKRMDVAAGVTSTLGQGVLVEDPFQVRGCRGLGFAPKLSLRALGETERRGHPSVRAVLRMPRRGANIARVGVSLPPSLFLDNANIVGICTREEFAARDCPRSSVYGFARAWSPLLEDPLAGPILMRSSNHRLPTLVADLNGQFRVAIGSRIDTDRGGIRTTIDRAPDVPVSKFTLRMKGGSTGLLQNAFDLCARPQQTAIEFEAHSGKVTTLEPLLKPSCPGDR